MHDIRPGGRPDPGTGESSPVLGVSFTPVNTLLTPPARCRRRRLTALTIILFALLPVLTAAQDASHGAGRGRTYEMKVSIDLGSPGADCHNLRIEVAQERRLLREMNWKKTGRHIDWVGDPMPEERDGQLVWLPAREGGWLEACVNLDHQRNGDGYDSRVSPAFALFRGDDLVPAAQTRTVVDAESRTTLTFLLPEGWSPATRFAELDDGAFLVDDPSRRFDRPTGWIVAGDLGIRRNRVAGMRVAVAGPVDHDIRRMDILAFLNFLAPEFDRVMPALPARLLIVSAGDPFWKGALSGPDSMYLHADRPLVSGNGTSTLVHELVHVFMGVTGGPDDDWLAEGLAEFYAIELMFRAGGMTEARRKNAWKDLERWGEDVKSLRGRASTGPVTARAAVFLRSLDSALREQGDATLDDVTAGLARRGEPLTLEGLVEVCTELAGEAACERLDSRLLQRRED